MRIAFAINGEGRGHVSRIKAIAETLCGRYEYTFYAPEHLRNELTREYPTSDFAPIPYLSFEQRGFTLDYGKTIAKNAATAINSFGTQASLARDLRERGIEAVLSDFEPFVPRAAKALGIPVLQLNHPGVVLRHGPRSAAHVASRAVALYMMAMSDREIICSFFAGDVGPIIRKELKEKKVSESGGVCVYVKDRYRDIIFPALDSLGVRDAIAFPDPSRDYAGELASCRALIAPAGHQSISEALALGKPCFVIPVEGQYEQELNAGMLRKSGCGDFPGEEGLEGSLATFFDRLDLHKRSIQLLHDPDFRTWRPEASFWKCVDDTDAATREVDRFFLEARSRPEWRRKRAGLALQTAIIAGGVSG